MTELSTFDLLIVHDFALEPMTRDESRDVYQLFVERSARARRSSLAFATPSSRLAVFDDMLLAQSAVHRRRVVPSTTQAHARREEPTAPGKKQPSGRHRNLRTLTSYATRRENEAAEFTGEGGRRDDGAPSN